jgi:hypothetical protein
MEADHKFCQKCGAPRPDASGGPPKAKKDAVSNEDFIVESILKKCSSMEQATKFFAWFRADPTKKIQGRMFKPEEVDKAETRCRQTWKAVEASSSSSSSSSDEEAAKKQKAAKAYIKAAASAKGAPAGAKPPLVAVAGTKNDKPSASVAAAKPVEKSGDVETGNVETILTYVKEKFKSMPKAEKFFDSLHDSIGRKNALGIVCSEEEVTEAWLSVTGHFEELDTAKTAKSGGGHASSDEDGASGVDWLVKKVLKKCPSLAKAEKCFEKLQATIGSMSHFGRVFSEEEVTEAWLHVEQELTEREAQEGADAADENGDSADEAEGDDEDPDGGVGFIVKYIRENCKTLAKA